MSSPDIFAIPDSRSYQVVLSSPCTSSYQTTRRVFEEGEYDFYGDAK